MDLYLPLKFLHIISSTLLFGTGLGTAYYLWRADCTGDATLIAAVARNVVLADWLFTTPAVIAQPLTGLGMINLAGIPLNTPWVLASLALYVFIGGCWLPVVWIQHQVAKQAAASTQTGVSLPARHRRLMTWWYGLGWPAFLGVIGVFYLMVFKPDLW
jgi:uncharacterized membrane protein